MSRNFNEPPSQRHQKSKKVFPESKNDYQNPADGKNRLTPASSEAWAEVLATADRYY